MGDSFLGQSLAPRGGCISAILAKPRSRGLHSSFSHPRGKNIYRHASGSHPALYFFLLLLPDSMQWIAISLRILFYSPAHEGFPPSRKEEEEEERISRENKEDTRTYILTYAR